MAGAGRIPTLTSRGGAQQRRRGADARRSGAVQYCCRRRFTLTALLAWLAGRIDEDFAATVNHLTLSVRRQPLLRRSPFGSPGEVLTLMGLR